MKLLASSCQEVCDDHLSPLTVAWQRVFMPIINVTAEEQARTREARADFPLAQLPTAEGPNPAGRPGAMSAQAGWLLAPPHVREQKCET